MGALLLVSIGVALLLAILLVRGSSPGIKPVQPHERDDLEAQLTRSIAEGRKIEAIKLYRRLHRVGLAEAKEAVERLQSGLPAS